MNTFKLYGLYLGGLYGVCKSTYEQETALCLLIYAGISLGLRLLYVLKWNQFETKLLLVLYFYWDP